VCALRSLVRHRDSLIQAASSHVLRMQKALNQMNLQIHHVISDITGVTGLRIIEAVLSGERDPIKLAALRDGRIKASGETIVKSLVGDYRREHLFTLRQSLLAWRSYQELMTECDHEIEEHLMGFDAQIDVLANPLSAAKVHRRHLYTNEPSFDLRGYLYRIFGVDLTAIPGISVLTAHTLLAEVGPDLSRFRSGAAFASWLGLCPDNDISGGKKLSVKTRPVNNRAATALRMAVNGLHKSQTWLGNFFRRMRAKLGTPKAITATAHKLARITYQILSTRQPYDESIFAQSEQTARLRTEAKLKAQAKALGFHLVPAEPMAS
jgi:transposase